MGRPKNFTDAEEVELEESLPDFRNAQKRGAVKAWIANFAANWNTTHPLPAPTAELIQKAGSVEAAAVKVAAKRQEVSDELC